MESHQLQTEVVLFEKRGHLPGRQCLPKHTTELHYGKCRMQGFWILTHTRDKKSGYLSLRCISFDRSFFNMSLSSPPTLWKCNINLGNAPLTSLYSLPVLFSQHPCIQKESHYIKFLCCDDEHTLLLWVNSIRIAKVSFNTIV